MNSFRNLRGSMWNVTGRVKQLWGHSPSWLCAFLPRHRPETRNQIQSVKRGIVAASLTCAAIILISVASLWVPIAHADHSDRAKVVGMKLMCMCGCNQVLIQCNHINCPSSAPMLKELETHISSGEADDLIVQDFVQEYGVQVLSSPPNKGFNRLAVLLPGIAFVVGLSMVIFVIMRWRRQIPVAASARREMQSKVSPDTMARARDLANRETED